MLWVATGVVAAATTAIALLLTNWKGAEGEQASGERIGSALSPGPRAASIVLKGTF